jgi:hypothetical protein
MTLPDFFERCNFSLCSRRAAQKGSVAGVGSGSGLL